MNSRQITECKLLFMRVSKNVNHVLNLLDATPPHPSRGRCWDHFGEDLYLFLVSFSQSQKEKELKQSSQFTSKTEPKSNHMKKKRGNSHQTHSAVVSLKVLNFPSGMNLKFNQQSLIHSLQFIMLCLTLLFWNVQITTIKINLKETPQKHKLQFHTNICPPWEVCPSFQLGFFTSTSAVEDLVQSLSCS